MQTRDEHTEERRRADHAVHRHPRLALQRLETVVFDVDGTLIDSNQAHAEAWAAALREHHLAAEVDEIRQLVGMGTDKFLPRIAGIDPESSEGRAVTKRKQAIFDERLPRLLPTRGSRALLTFLHDAGKRVVVATSAGDDEKQALLEQADVHDLIPQAASKDDAARSKPDPDIVHAALARAHSRADTAVLIGDTPYDIEAAHRARLAIIALRCGGYWSDAALSGADAIFDDPAALLAYWRVHDTA